MHYTLCTKEKAIAANDRFDREIVRILASWALRYEQKNDSLRAKGQPFASYLETTALQDFFQHQPHPFHTLLENKYISNHVTRKTDDVYFDPETGDPLLSRLEQRLYNLAARSPNDHINIPYRSIATKKQSAEGDNIDPEHYTPQSQATYNTGNHFATRASNINIFRGNKIRLTALEKPDSDLHVLAKGNYLEEALRDAYAMTKQLEKTGATKPQFFIIYSRHSKKEQHYETSLVVMDPTKPEWPQRILFCDTLLKELPHHPRWWKSFVEEYSKVFGEYIHGMMEDISHPLQKINCSDEPIYRYDFNCSYYCASMAESLIKLVQNNPKLILNGSPEEICYGMKHYMPEYYSPDGELVERSEVKSAHLLKRWEDGSASINRLIGKDLRAHMEQKELDKMTYMNVKSNSTMAR